MSSRSISAGSSSGTFRFISVLAALLLMISACDNGLNDPKSDSYDAAIRAKSDNAANCDNQVNNTTKKLLECVTLEGVRSHQAALQNIADANGGDRSAGSSGYSASADYVSDLLMEAGYIVERQAVEFTTYRQLGPTILEQISPVATTYTEGVDHAIMSYSAAADVTAPVSAVDLDLGSGNNSSSGCEPTDFAGFPVGSIALVQRGACTFQLKAENAEAAGAVGVIIFNQGNTPGREVFFAGTLTENYAGSLPVVSATYARGVEWAGTPGLTLRLAVDAGIVELSADNILADLPGKNTGNVVMAGAVLDSPLGSPGINNNGSGSAAVLETALQMAKVRPQNSLRFAWWGADNFGLRGSQEYLLNLPEEEFQKIAAYLNFDVIGSPNYVTFIYDGDDSDGNNPIPAIPGSEVIEDLFQSYYDDIVQPTKGINLYFGTASQNFLLSGVPSGGIYSGSFEIKTAEEASIWGGSSGDQLDPCTFLACDTFDNVSLEALDFNSDAAAYAILNLAMNTSLINGEKAKGNFKAKRNALTE
ncbi:M28 family peptidase [Balneola sp. MJW-20]|uniref:M28 family peptidase n=1 Tax=Gracilimonas aurantiaca TaxID=3234185 RepID=UPI003467C22F